MTLSKLRQSLKLLIKCLRKKMVHKGMAWWDQAYVMPFPEVKPDAKVAAIPILTHVSQIGHLICNSKFGYPIAN